MDWGHSDSAVTALPSRRFVAYARLAECVVAVILLTGTLVGAPEAKAAWSAPSRVLGDPHFGNAVVAFDPLGVPWVVWIGVRRDSTPSGVYVARLSGHYRLTSIHLVPGTRAQIIEGPLSFAIDSSGFAVVAWSYITEYGFGAPRGSAAATWRLGGAPRGHVALIPAPGPDGGEVQAPVVATSSSGTTVVLYGESQFVGRDGTVVGRVDVARFRAGHVVGRQRLASITRAPEQSDNFRGAVSRVSGGGFEAVLGPLNLGQRGSGEARGESARAGPSGVFGATTFTRLPLEQVPTSIFGAQQVFSDARTDQLAVWVVEAPAGAGPYGTLYVSSRSAGGAFGAARLVGRSDETNAPHVATDGSGGFTVGLEQAHRVLVAEGRFGGAVTAPVVLATGVGSGDLRLAVTRTGETIATWWVEKRPGESLYQAAVSRDGLHFGGAQTLFRVPRHMICSGGQPTPEPQGGALVEIGCSTAGAQRVYLINYHP
jgi:hypothetical protein